MKYSARVYAQALVEALGEHDGKTKDEAAIGKNFLALVERNGDGGQLKKILNEASRLARGKSGIRQVTIESARELSSAQKATLRQFVKPHDVLEERIDPGLIAGIKITMDDEMQFDGSLKTKLNKALGGV